MGSKRENKENGSKCDYKKIGRSRKTIFKT